MAPMVNDCAQVPAGLFALPVGAAQSPGGVLGMPTIIPADISLSDIERDLADDRVSAPAADVPGLVAVSKKAQAKGHDMYFVVLEQDQDKFTYLRDIATALQHKTGGTVIVFSPSTLGTASDDFSRVQLEQAQDRVANHNPTLSANQMLDRMTEQTQVPWTVVTLGLILVVVLGAVGARLRGTRRRSAVTDTNASSAPRGEGTGPEADPS
ncbi:DUF6676 family protein [Williamsia sp. CHRR-6]|uniref:Rv1476 family membrane protein n=1 Tax=Williamsia sp. CHRR-6 TaxID=2835871 RepID=UPI001BDA2E18|nr:DUF6676 family protein [Williamsia sp. CHRR-6]MBT0568063.1 hypothetical protein [Williamsia sp. CHRR-6]